MPYVQRINGEVVAFFAVEQTFAKEFLPEESAEIAEFEAKKLAVIAAADP